MFQKQMVLGLDLHESSNRLGNDLQGPCEQFVELETGRLRRAIASDISIQIAIQSVARKRNVRISVRIGEVESASVDYFAFYISGRCPDQTLVFLIAQDHVLLNA